MKKILIVDDSSFMRNVLKDLLLNTPENSPLLSELEFHEADGKESGIKLLKTIKPDLVLLDVVMSESETEGLEFIDAVKDFFDPKKIIMISSVGQSNIVNECKKKGILIYLHKPFEQEEVIEAVNRGLT